MKIYQSINNLLIDYSILQKVWNTVKQKSIINNTVGVINLKICSFIVKYLLE